MEITVNNLVPFSVALLAGIAFYWYFNKNKHKPPSKWEPIGTVTKLFLYPLKGGRRVELDHAICTKQGCVMPKNGSIYQFKDRNIICYKEKTFEFCGYPKLKLVVVKACDDNHFILSALNTPPLKVKIPDAVQNKTKKEQLIIWTQENVNKYDCGNEAAKWISLVCGYESGLRLGFFDKNFRGNIERVSKKCLKVHPNVKSESADLYSDLSTGYLIVNQASVDDISGKLPDENVTVNNFRPNILVEGKNLKPFDEDDWKWIKIGDVVLYAVKPCLRCSMVTINPDTGEKSKQQEPLRTLRQYRKLRDLMNINYTGHEPVFGNQMDLEHEGDIKVGDTVFVGQ